MVDEENNDELVETADDEPVEKPEPVKPPVRPKRIVAELSETDRELLRNTAKSTSELVDALITEPHEDVTTDKSGEGHGIESSIVEPPPPPTPKQEELSPEAQAAQRRRRFW
ncbi:MAG: hypothetical protein ABSC73_09045 [Acidimicrobiales bacterium]|jgi:hypothetical protein